MRSASVSTLLDEEKETSKSDEEKTTQFVKEFGRVGLPVTYFPGAT